MNSNSYSIIAYSIPCNIDSYYSVITITAYQTSPNLLSQVLSIKGPKIEIMDWPCHSTLGPKITHTSKSVTPNKSISSWVYSWENSQTIPASHIKTIQRGDPRLLVVYGMYRFPILVWSNIMHYIICVQNDLVNCNQSIGVVAQLASA